MKAILLVTWFVTGEAPAVDQIMFASLGACAQAKANVIEQGARLQTEEHERAPKVLAVCAPLD
jgi:hypothetical protein